MAITTFPFLWDTLIGHMVVDIFGSPMIAGMFGLFFFYVFGLALRLTLEVQIVMMFFVAVLLIGTFIPWLPIVLSIVIGVGLAIFLIATIFQK